MEGRKEDPFRSPDEGCVVYSRARAYHQIGRYSLFNRDECSDQPAISCFLAGHSLCTFIHSSGTR